MELCTVIWSVHNKWSLCSPKLIKIQVHSDLSSPRWQPARLKDGCRMEKQQSQTKQEWFICYCMNGSHEAKPYLENTMLCTSHHSICCLGKALDNSCRLSLFQTQLWRRSSWISVPPEKLSVGAGSDDASSEGEIVFLLFFLAAFAVKMSLQRLSL